MFDDLDVVITEVALRDGSHAVRHSFTEEQVRNVVGALDAAKVPYIEVSHGDGLGGSTLQYGMSKVDEFKLIQAAVETASYSKIAVLLLPGIGTVHELKRARELGASLVRVATHVTEADVSRQHIEEARKMGLTTFGFLMMAHMAPLDKLIEQAKLMESYGAEAVYMTDSAGTMLPDQVFERIAALKSELSIEVGFHAHNNLGLAMGNTLAAIKAGATRIDGSIRALGAGAGNTQTEVLVAALDKMGIKTGIDLYKIMDAAEDVVAPLLLTPQEITKDSLTMGYAGVYSSFRLHAQRAGEKYGIDPRDILIELGREKVVGGQEDMIIDVAKRMKQERG
ncbi:4-hyroxy-2-oxovalerate/4-hydroxy-2-oxopentanoic acid aldolase [Listeria floridensis FSL S10-1187]|uniref:4-hydroxy-2-oxovalerate aldolase n=1 Tax=Listeria floridensis FSL S10-1187 TaxID=1265817 RepID=A0ABN0RCF5_9LIST|nr:4-hydroxy-2-oxovalerate aldolase [Listeria floridensis]EUJ26756.1 4-hyroxy-2-oxovalerate/4-hydroxy-2-oxopentanoic acid aldolase [Listeria floridensis FSL S10-1187]